jgi:hypothetical protein
MRSVLKPRPASGGTEMMGRTTNAAASIVRDHRVGGTFVFSYPADPREAGLIATG